MDIDYYEHLVKCELCEDLYCTKCDDHWYDCPCKGPFSEEEE